MSADDDNFKLLAGFAQRLQSDPTFMAHSLAVYQKKKGLDDEALAEELGTIPEMVMRLSLCKRPDMGAPDFAEQVRELSDFTLIDESLLRHVIEETKSAPAAHHAISRVEKAASPGTLVHWLSTLSAWARALSRPPLTLAASTVLLLAVATLLFIWREHSAALRSQSVQFRPQPAAPSASIAQEVSPPPVQSAPTADQQSPELLAQVKVDLDNYTSLRAANEASSGSKAIQLKPSRIHLTLRLPEGSTSGLYHVSIVDTDGKLLSSDDQKSRDGRLLIVTLDLRGLSQKTYRLSVMHEGEAPDVYPVLITNAKTATRQLKQ